MTSLLKKTGKLKFFNNEVLFLILLVISLLISLSLSSFIAFDYGYCRDLRKYQSNLGGSPIINKEKLTAGYTLFPAPPTPELLSKNKNKEGAIYLVDLYGKPVHSWSVDVRAMYAMLKKNGNVMAALTLPVTDPTLPPGASGAIQELDWQSNVIWEYKNPMLHHDFDILPNDNIIVTLREVLPKEFESRVQGGVPGSEVADKMYGGGIAEIDRNGKIVWEWHAKDHLDPVEDAIYDLGPRWEWTHFNTVRYIPKDPFNGEEAYILSSRSMSKVILISKKDGKVLWKSPNNLVSVQHDPSVLPNGNILIFDNGMYRQGVKGSFIGSRVVEVDPKQNKIIWEFRNGDMLTSMSRFIVPIMGAVQRMDNGNLFITDASNGYLFEITKDKELVWGYRNPFGFDKSLPYPNYFIFKARKYPPSEINWPEKLPEPLPTLPLVCDKLG